MTAHIRYLPNIAIACDRINERAKAENIAAERAEYVRIARAMMVSPSYYSDDELRDACAALQAWGDATDYCTADAMIFAINKREWQARNLPRETSADIARAVVRDRLPEVLIYAAIGAVVILRVAGWL